MNSSLDDVAFLSRSENRVRVLDAIHEQPRTRHELKELTDVSRFTLSRTLADFEDREWIERDGKRYRTTGKGAVVATEFETLLANLDVAESLDGTLWWLPNWQFVFDLRYLRGDDRAPRRGLVLVVSPDDPLSVGEIGEDPAEGGA